MRGKVRVPGDRTFMQNCVKRSRELTYLVWSTTSCGAVNCGSRPPTCHTPVHSGCSPQEVDGLAVLPGDGTQTSLAPEFVRVTFCQPPAKFLGVMLAAWHDCAHDQDSQFVLQQEEERDSMWFLLVTCEFSMRRRTTLLVDPEGQWRSLTRPV